MFDQIGTKIKKVAKICYHIGEISSITIGIILFFMAFINWDDTWFLMFVGPAIAALGWLMSWLSVLCIYGFGELIEKTTEIERHMRIGEMKSEAQSKVDFERNQRIERLRSQGLITEEEYQQAITKKQ